MKIRGFTLLELLVTIAIAAILLAVAAPSFTGIIRGNALSSARDGLYSALQYARSEALTRNVAVAVCAAADENLNACSDDEDAWANGWLVFIDSSTGNGATIAAANTDILRVHEGSNGIEVKYVTNGGGKHVRYLSSGILASGFTGGVFSLCDVDDEARARSVLIGTVAGQIRTGGEDDADCT